ncbi:MAG: hypothetical protein H6625_09165 [Bdellovibrionaceae bacterium]|nr:hypothetical protein [Pseudobdellovibrionaceae bacterium]
MTNPTDAMTKTHEPLQVRLVLLSVGHFGKLDIWRSMMNKINPIKLIVNIRTIVSISLYVLLLSSHLQAEEGIRFFSDNISSKPYLYGTNCEDLRKQALEIVKLRTKKDRPQVKSLRSCENVSMSEASEINFKEEIGSADGKYKTTTFSSSKLKYRIDIENLIPHRILPLLHLAKVTAIIDCRSSAAFVADLTSAPVNSMLRLPNILCKEVKTPKTGDIVRSSAHDAIFISEDLFLSKTAPSGKYALRFMDYKYISSIFYETGNSNIDGKQYFRCQSIDDYFKHNKVLLTNSEVSAIGKIKHAEKSLFKNLIAREPSFGLKSNCHNIVQQLLGDSDVKNLLKRFPTLPASYYHTQMCDPFYLDFRNDLSKSPKEIN